MYTPPITISRVASCNMPDDPPLSIIHYVQEVCNLDETNCLQQRLLWGRIDYRRFVMWNKCTIAVNPLRKHWRPWGRRDTSYLDFNLRNTELPDVLWQEQIGCERRLGDMVTHIRSFCKEHSLFVMDDLIIFSCSYDVIAFELSLSGPTARIYYYSSGCATAHPKF